MINNSTPDQPQPALSTLQQELEVLHKKHLDGFENRVDVMEDIGYKPIQRTTKLGSGVVEATKPELPANVRQRIDETRAKTPSLDEQIVRRQRARYNSLPPQEG